VEKNDDLMQNIWAPSHRRMGRLRGQLQPGRYGHGTSARCPPESTVRGLICLGCAHAQPEEVCVPISRRRMLATHERSLGAA
jgi:hypothetical protein